MGWVGLGNRGGKHIKTMLQVGAGEVYMKAICDTFSPRLAKSKDDVATQQHTAPDTYNDYYKMLEDKSIDAVGIFTPNTCTATWCSPRSRPASTSTARSR